MRSVLSSSVLAAVLGAAAALPASAAGIVAAPQPMMAPVSAVPMYDWTGLSGGVQLSYGDIDSNGAPDGSGALYGLRAYYDAEFGGVILGAGIQTDFADIDLGGGVSLENVLRAGVRAGIDSGRNFFYVGGGWSRADIEIGAIENESDGYYVGAGYEVFVTEGITLGSEINYHEFDDFSAAPGLEVEATTVNLSVNFRY